jgi:hypothetical protein
MYHKQMHKDDMKILSIKTIFSRPVHPFFCHRALLINAMDPWVYSLLFLTNGIGHMKYRL